MKMLFTAFAATCAIALAVMAAEPAAIAAPQFDSQRITVEVMGAGPDVILIPGLATPRAVWMPTAKRLQSDHRVHLVQLRGFGDAPQANAEGPVLRPIVEELARYITANRLASPAIVGHSLGGLAAMMLAANHPTLPGRIMAVDTLPFIGTILAPGTTAQTIEPRAAQMRDLIAGGNALPPPQTRDCNAVEGSGEPPRGSLSNTARGACLVATWSAAADPDVVGQAMYDDMTTDLRQRIADIKVPLTVLYAQDDRAFPAPMVRALYNDAYAAAPDTRLEMIPGSYHFIMLDQPAKFAAALDRFLAR